MESSVDEPKRTFKNVTEITQGVVIIDHKGDPKGVSVYPGDLVRLSHREQVLTANAPKLAEHNPFANGALAPDDSQRFVPGMEERVVPGMAESPEEPEQPPAQPPQERPAEEPIEETGAPPLPPGDPVEGERGPGEEVGTPDAVGREEPEAGHDEPQPVGTGQRPATAHAIRTPAPVGATPEKDPEPAKGPTPVGG